MENQNNIDKYFRKLSEEQEPKAFKNMDAIWDKVEEKLDEKKKKRIIPIWKYFEIKNGVKYAGIAATLLLLITFGSRFINQNPKIENSESETDKVVFVDENKIKEEFESNQKKETIVFEDVTPKDNDSFNKNIVSSDDLKIYPAEEIVSAEISEDNFAKTKDSFAYKENFSEKITGNVISKEDGLPLIGATVVVKGTDNAVQTDIDGNFSLQVKEGQELEVSYVGMEKQNLVVTSTNQFNVALANDYKIGEAVTLEYGRAVKKYPLAETTVTAKEIEKATMTITGVVISAEDGLPLPGITVIVKGTTNGTLTDLDGKYSIEATKGNVLVFSFEEMKTKEVKIENHKEINIILD